MKTFLLAGLLASVGSVNAAIIDFEDLGVSSGTQLDPGGSTVTSNGFDFVKGPSSVIPDLHIPNNSANAIGSTTELVSHGDLIMTQSGGGNFSLDSFDFGSSFNEVATFSVVGSLLGGGTVSQIFNLDGDETTFENFVLNASFSNIVSAQWLMVGGVQGLFNIDNISVSQAGVNAVPVPAALFMFAPALLGFLGLRRKAKA